MCAVPICLIDYWPRFPFFHTDEFWCKEIETRATFPRSRSSDQFTNETSIAIPDAIAHRLEKGPNYRVPHKFDKKFIDDLKLSLETITYRLRWHEALKLKHDVKNNYIPFHKNSVNLPCKIDEEKEKDLISLKHDIMHNAKIVLTNVSKNLRFKNISKQIDRSKHFFKKNDLVVVPYSDKTKKLAIEAAGDLISRTENILPDSNTYMSSLKIPSD